MKTSRISKVAGLSVAGFCAVSIAADRLNLNPMASQIAGFAGAFLGAYVGRLKRARQPSEPGLGRVAEAPETKIRVTEAGVRAEVSRPGADTS